MRLATQITIRVKFCDDDFDHEFWCDFLEEAIVNSLADEAHVSKSEYTIETIPDTVRA